MPSRGFPAVTDARNGQRARSIGLAGQRRVGLETRVVGLERPLPAAQSCETLVVLREPKRDRGQPVVGRHDGRVHILQGLPAVGAGAEGPGPLAPVQHGLVGQKARGERGAAAREIAPVVVVAHPVEVEPRAQRALQVQPAQARNTLQAVLVLQRIAPAVGIAQFVVRHEGRTQLAAVRGLQVTELAPQIHPALTHEGGEERGVEVGRQVQVVREREFQPADVVEIDRRRQHAALAFVGQRKAEVGPAQDGHALELQHATDRRAHLVGVVQFDAAGPQQPVGHPGCTGCARAGGIARIAHVHFVVAQKVHPARIAMAFALQQ